MFKTAYTIHGAGGQFLPVTGQSAKTRALWENWEEGAREHDKKHQRRLVFGKAAHI